MKKSVLIVVSIFFALNMMAQTKEKTKAANSDSTKVCTSKSGKHCSKPSRR